MGIKINVYKLVFESVLTASAHRPTKGQHEKNEKCRQADVVISINRQGKLEMFFPLSGILPCTQEAIFNAHVFPMPQPYHLTDQVLMRLGAGAPRVIPAGNYPIKKVKNGYIITF